MPSLLRALTLAAVVFAMAARPASSGTDSQLAYIGTWPHQIVVFDSAQEKIVDRIDLNTDVAHVLVPSTDRKKLYASTLNDNAIVTIDTQTNKVLGSFTIDQGNRHVRLNGLAVDPGGKYLYGVGTTVVLQTDHYDIESPEFFVIDLANQRISRIADYPKDENLYGYQTQMKVSPDGKYLYVFRDNILIFDTANFGVVKKIALAKPPVADMENLAIHVVDDPNEAPGKVISVFNASDPYVHRQVFGLAEVDLEKMSFDFTPIGPATVSMLPLYLTPDRKRAYTVAVVNGAIGSRQYEFWAFDMETRKLINRRAFDGRNRLSAFAVSADGTKLFVYGAGFQIEVYDAQSFQMRSDIDLPGDITTNMVVLPLAATVGKSVLRKHSLSIATH